MNREKMKRQSRMRQKRNHIKRQNKLRRELMYIIHNDATFEEHRLHKRKALNCGDPNCVMCGNPRKFWGHVTRQEEKHSLSWNLDTMYMEEMDGTTVL